jgi:HK97 family phage major capsid protein
MSVAVQNPTVKLLQEQRNKCWHEATKVASRASEENRAMTGEEDRQWNEAMSEMKRLDTRVSEILTGEERAKTSEARIAALAGQPIDPGATDGGGITPQQSAEQEATELRRFLKGETRSYELRLPTAVERRTLLDSTTPLPTSFVGQLYRFLVDTSSIRQTNPTIYSTASGENLVVPRSTSEGGATWTGEGVALSADDPTLQSITLSAFKIAKIMQISSELLSDTGFDIVGYMAESAGRNLGIAVDSAYVAGTGGIQPTGFTNAISGAAVALSSPTGVGGDIGFPTSGSVVGADVLIDLYHSIIPQYRPRSSWVMHDQTIKQVRKLKDTTGQYIWQPALVAGQPDTILGRPVYADPNMPKFALTPGSGTASPVIAYGDFGGYFIRDVTPIRFERSDDFAFNQDLVSFRAIYRTDGKLGDTQAVKLYQSAAS